ncbi:MAG: chemotaxis protein CheW [Polyangiales bacterium]
MSDVRQLREDFDRSFAEAPTPRGAAPEEFLAVRVGGEPYALRLSEVVALHRDVLVSPYVVGANPVLLGLAVFHGAAAPVYDLGALLGAPARPPPRWVVLARAPALVGLAFDRFEAHVAVDAGELVAAAQGAPGGAMVRGAVPVGGAARPLVHVRSVVDAIERLIRPRGEGL